MTFINSIEQLLLFISIPQCTKYRYPELRKCSDSPSHPRPSGFSGQWTTSFLLNQNSATFEAYTIKNVSLESLNGPLWMRSDNDSAEKAAQNMDDAFVDDLGTKRVPSIIAKANLQQDKKAS